MKTEDFFSVIIRQKKTRALFKARVFGGDNRARTYDPLHVKQVL